MSVSSFSSLSDLSTSFAKKTWEDPCFTVERMLEVSAQGRPPTGGAPEFRPFQGFLGPLSTSGGSGNC
jgi:hypothetical protein